VNKTNPAFERWQVIISYPESLSTVSNAKKIVGNETRAVSFKWFV